LVDKIVRKVVCLNARNLFLYTIIRYILYIHFDIVQAIILLLPIKINIFSNLEAFVVN